MLTANDQLRIINFLKQFDCNSRESIAYMESLKLGTTSVQELARHLNRNRITVHYTVQQLLKKGLLFETRKGKKRLISAESPEVLSRIIEQKFNQLKAMEPHLDYITKLLNSVQSVKHEQTVIKVYEDGANGFKKMLEETFQSKEELLILSNKGILSTILGEEYFENYFRRRSELGLHSRIIYPPGTFTDKIASKSADYLLQLKLMPSKGSSEAGLFIWGNSTSIESIKEGKTNCTIIDNKDITNFFRKNIFEHFWSEAEPYKKM